MLGILVGQLHIVKVRVASLALLLVEVCGEVLRDEPIEQHAEHVALEVPAVYGAAQIVGDAPDGLVQLGSLRFLGSWGHVHDTASVVPPHSSSQLFKRELYRSVFNTWRPPRSSSLSPP